MSVIAYLPCMIIYGAAKNEEACYIAEALGGAVFEQVVTIGGKALREVVFG